MSRGLVLSLLSLVLLAQAACTATRAHRHQRFSDDVARTVAAPGVIESETLTPEPFDEALISWDISLGEGSAARLETRVARGGVWSEWLTLGVRGDREAAFPSEPLRRSGGDRVDVDVLICQEPADQLAWRAVVAGDGSAEIRSVLVTTTGVARGQSFRMGPRPRPIAHTVPHMAQRDGGAELSGRLCSPTAVAMVIGSQGVDIGVKEMADRVYDHAFDLYGNWVNNTLAASELGVPMHATRVGSWAEAQEHLARGPMVISLPPFSKSELRGAGYRSRSGHLIVIRGFDKWGDVLVRDPAHAEATEAARTYRLDQVTRLWLVRNKGTAYVLTDSEAPQP